jgi:signal transduction histidine kinase
MQLAHALHDEAAQTLANVALQLQICERARAFVSSASARRCAVTPAPFRRATG